MEVARGRLDRKDKARSIVDGLYIWQDFRLNCRLAKVNEPKQLTDDAFVAENLARWRE